MGLHQAKLEQKGALLGRIVDIGSELYAIACACTYANTIAKRNPERAESAFELADLFCNQARRRAETLFSELFSNDDGDQYELAQELLDGRYAWFEEDVIDPAGSGPMIPDTARELQEATPA